MVRLVIEVGRTSSIRPNDVVGAIANEAAVPGNVIGAIDIYDNFTFVDIPARYLHQVLEGMAGVSVRGNAANLRVGQRPRSTGALVRAQTSPRANQSSRGAKKCRQPLYAKKFANLIALLRSPARACWAPQQGQPDTPTFGEKDAHLRSRHPSCCL